MRVGFCGASYYGRASGYTATIEDWGVAEKRVIDNMCLAEFDRICADVAGAGFKYMELWMGHAFPKYVTPGYAQDLRKIWEKHGLSLISYSCSLGNPAQSVTWARYCFEAAKMLGIPMITSGINKESAPIVHELCKEYGIRVAVENHPEKDPNEIRAIIGDYGDLLGACVDTGWFATQGYPAADALRQLKDLLIHVHLKDVKEAGAHHTTRLGTGVMGGEAALAALKEIGYNGTLSIEHEASGYDPTPDCAYARQVVEQQFPQD